MFNTLSRGGIATYVLVIEGVLKLIGVEAPEGSVESIVVGVVNFISLVLLVWSTFGRNDLVAGIVRKK